MQNIKGSFDNFPEPVDIVGSSHTSKEETASEIEVRAATIIQAAFRRYNVIMQQHMNHSHYANGIAQKLVTPPQ